MLPDGLEGWDEVADGREGSCACLWLTHVDVCMAEARAML